MKKRKTAARWVADLFKTPELQRRADLADRRIDQKVGAQIKGATDKTAETDWRRLAKRRKGEFL